MALVSNSGQIPTGFVDENWSALVIIREVADVVSSAGSDYYARLIAWQAQATAQVGTNTAYNALFTAWAGTDAANNAYSIAAVSYPLARSGTELARLALQIASEGTNTGSAALGRADYAIALAATGTAAAQFAIEVAASGTAAAQFAIALAASGTEAAQFAIDVAVAGTDAAANAAAIGGAAYALAMLGTATADLALQIAIEGTNTGTAALGRADYAIQLAATGTAAVVGETGSRSFQDTAEGQYRAYIDGTLATRLIGVEQAISSSLSLAAVGTRIYNMSQIISSNRSDIQVTVVNGAVTAAGNSAYSVETFDDYAVGPIGTALGDLGLLTSWYGTGAVVGPRADPVSSLQSFVSVEAFSSYATGTVFGMVLVPGTLTSGSYWAAGWTAGSIAENVASDSLLTYTAGTLVVGALSAGSNWSGSGAVI